MAGTPNIATFYDTGTGVSSNFYTLAEAASTFTGSGSVSSDFEGLTGSETTATFSGTGSVISSFLASGAATATFTGGGETLANFESNYESEHHHYEFYPLSDFPCAICCMVPDSLCVEIKVCGQVFRTRIKRGHKPNYPDDWEACTGAGNAYAYMVCNQTTGMVSIFVEVVIGNGFIFDYKLPLTLCPFYVEWTRPGLPTVRCSQFVIEEVEYVKVYQGSDCGDCEGGNGVTSKTVTESITPCCAVCTCCSLMPGRDKLRAKIEAFGCDFDGVELLLEAEINDCEWTATLTGGEDYSNCPDVTINAECLGGYWQVELVTDALEGCTPDPFKVILAQCDTFRVEAISTCQAVDNNS